jgi:hypothetical protein
MHKGKELSLEIAIVMPAMLLRYRADEGVLNEIIGPEHIVGQRAGIAPQTRDCFSRSRPKSFILAAYGLGKVSAGWCT